ncbi:MAG TPA: hypothetical protein VN033_13480 [Vulgatibacter sp.]|nr:hypothetical protein [Vulgatibacter sp.]
MNKARFFFLVGALALLASGCASKHILVGQTFIGEDRSIKMMMTAPMGSDDDRMVHQLMRICTLNDGSETNCKDTVVLENVRPGSLY